MFGPGLYVLATTFAPELIPVRMLATLALAEQQTPLPPMLEMLTVTLLLEIVREAGLRAPHSIGHTVSIVGALIIGGNGGLCRHCQRPYPHNGGSSHHRNARRALLI